jgi:hypothetical protein
MKSVVIYSTCQGVNMYQFLMKSPNFVSNYILNLEIRNYEAIMGNYRVIDNPTIIESLKTCDVFIYQPLEYKGSDPVFIGNSTNEVLKYLNPEAVKIAIPYVRLTSLWPIFPTTHGALQYDMGNMRSRGVEIIDRNTKVLDDLLEAGYDKQEIMDMFTNNEIDWNFDYRYNFDLKLLENKEKGCDIKVSDFIRFHISDLQLFVYCSHPTSHLFKHMANQVLDKLGIERLTETFPLNMCNLDSTVPTSFPTCSINHYKMNFVDDNTRLAVDKWYFNYIYGYINGKLNLN